MSAPEQAERALRRRFERVAKNYQLDFTRHPDNKEQYLQYATELAFTFFQLGARK